MAKERIMAFLKRAVATIILFAVYVLIVEVAYMDVDVEIEPVVILGGLFIAVIVVPIIYHNITINRLKLDFGRRLDYYVDQTVVFLFLVFLAFNFYLIIYDDGIERTFYQDNTPFEKCLLYIFMYIIGVWIYALVSYIARTIKDKTYGDLLKRVLSVVIGFPLYILAVLIPMSWIEWIEPVNLAEVVFYLFYLFTAGAVTGVFHFILKRLLKVSYEKAEDHAFFVGFFCIVAVLGFALNSVFGVISEGFRDLIPVYSLHALFKYIVGNMVYYIWCNEIKRKKRSITGDSEKEESESTDNDLDEDEYGIEKLSSEIVLIPGIDEEWKEGR